MIITRRSFWVILFLALVCFIAADVPTLGESDLFIRLTYLWLFLLGSSWLLTILSLRQISFQRKAREYRLQVGQVFKERFEIVNKSFFFHLWIEIHDETDLPGSTASRILTGIGWKQTRSYQSYTWLNNRGLFRLGPITLVSGDLFGIFQKTKKILSCENLLVTPYMVELNSFPLPCDYLHGGQVLRRPTSEITPNAAGIRDYLPGDAMNRIHWPTTIHRDKLMVKEFDQDPQTEVWIFLDAQKEIQAIQPEKLPEQEGELSWLLNRKKEVTLPSSTIEYSISIAASIANYFIKRGQDVGLVCSGQVNIVLPAEKSDRQIGKILENLALLQPIGIIPLSNLVGMQIGHLAKGSVIVLITPSTDEEIVFTVDELILRKMNPIVILLDPSTFGSDNNPKLVEANLKGKRIPLFHISNHTDIEESLGQGGQILQREQTKLNYE